MIAPVPPDPEPIYTGTSVCYASGYEPPAKYVTGMDSVVSVLVVALVILVAVACVYFVGRDFVEARQARDGRRASINSDGLTSNRTISVNAIAAGLDTGYFPDCQRRDVRMSIANSRATPA